MREAEYVSLCRKDQDVCVCVCVCVCISSVAQSCPTLCDPMDCSTLGFPVHHQLPELVQTHVHRVDDVIQPSHLLSSPSPPTFNLSQHQVFSKESVLCIRWPKDWSFSFSISPSNEYSGLISFRTDWFDFLAVQCTVKRFTYCGSLAWRILSIILLACEMNISNNFERISDLEII